jgi:uncharacterized protein YnzC (UPF0291/DUF896 family)
VFGYILNARNNSEIRRSFRNVAKKNEPLDWFELNDPEQNRKEYTKRLRGNFRYKKIILKISETAAIYKHGSEFFLYGCKITTHHILYVL